MSSSASAEREISYAEAILEATRQEMERDEGVVVIGQGVDDCKGMQGTTLGLHTQFGANRCFDVPLAEDGILGVAIGAAGAGLRPINVHQRMDFLLVCMNQLVNIAAKTSYMYAGTQSVPLVVRATVGRSWGQGPQHSQALHALMMHVPGLKVVAPSTPHHAKGCLIAAIRDNNPVVYMENRVLFGIKGVVPEQPYEFPFGQAQLMAPGDDVTIVAVSHMVAEALRARRLLADIGISAEVIDPVSLSPLDFETMRASAARTGRLLVVDNGWTMCGASAEILARAAETDWTGRTPMMRRMGFAATPCPTTKALENHFYPNARTIAVQAHRMVRGAGAPSWQPEAEIAKEVAEFRGPF